jgi:hypothetical protein
MKRWLLTSSVFLLSLIGIYLFQAANSIPDNVIAVLHTAGQNESELVKVIDHFKNQEDKRKLKAAYFLISNMTNRFHNVGPEIERSRKLFAIMNSLAEHGHNNIGHAWDSLENLYPAKDQETIDTVWDANVIKADIMIRHIDAAFVAWNYPWARNVSFNDFCEYLLPYKLLNEEPALWNSLIQASYSWMLDSSHVHEISDARSACLLINKQLKKSFFIGSYNSSYDINFTDLSMLRTGSCFRATQFSAYCMRAMGIPVTLDFTPYWANKNGGHSWNAFLEGKKAIPFMGTESDPGKTKIGYSFFRKCAKIFRQMYSLQKNNIAMMATETEEIPALFRTPYIADVTAQYEPVADVTVTVNGTVPDAKYVYLCVYNKQKWRPVHWGKINKDRQVVFKDMGKEIVYTPMYFRDNKFIPAGPPFILNSKGIREPLVPNIEKRIPVTIYKKGLTGSKIAVNTEYELFYWNDRWTPLGKYCATADSLICKNVPQNALLIVTDHNQPDQDRIFTYKNKKQVWW